ncbi:MAG TPA: acyl-CoA dehydrogenase family protein [Rhodanobacter sp.]|jgi:Acyl-CoA dehydrogenases|nr:acyl-CoA dehydrogenase family protein [Rhodanobacter sp.]
MDFSLSEEQQALKAMVADFVRKEVAEGAEKRDREAVFHKDLFARVAALGIPSIPHDVANGGLGLGSFEMALALEEIARVDQSLAITTMVNAASGLTFVRNASDVLKDRWMADIVSGKAICSLAGTEPGAGSDTAGSITRARQDADGNWIINGEKAYITNPGTEISSFTMVMAVTSEPDVIPKRFTLFLVPTGTPGYEIGASYNKMGWRSSDTRPLYFNDCKVGPEAVIGEVGKGRATTISGFKQARVFLAACSMGLAQGSLDAAVAYAKERKAYGASIGRLQLVQEMIAKIAVKVETARMLVYRAAWLVDQGTATLQDLAMAKYYCTEIGTECADLAVQVHGGWGFMDDCPPSRYLRDNRVCTIGDGSSQIQLLLIARELGLDVVFNA